jgi:hypothetical protein
MLVASSFLYICSAFAIVALTLERRAPDAQLGFDCRELALGGVDLIDCCLRPRDRAA